MGKFFKLFFGTPRRFLVSLVAMGIIFVMIFPDTFSEGVLNFIHAFKPLIGPVLTVVIAIVAIRMIIGKK
jgi:asparagine N-glycosylation enzyme membrane subunit Stt3